MHTTDRDCSAPAGRGISGAHNPTQRVPLLGPAPSDVRAIISLLSHRSAQSGIHSRAGFEGRGAGGVLP